MRTTIRNLALLVTPAAIAASPLLWAGKAKASTGAPGPATSSSSAVTVAIGSAALFQDLKIEFLSVLSDSRCPVGTTCVSAGNAAVALRVTKMSEVAPPEGHALPTYPLNLNSLLAPTAGDAAGWQLSFVSLDPSPTAKVPRPDPSSYKLTLKLDPLASPAAAAAVPTRPKLPLAPATVTIGRGKSVAWQHLSVQFVEVIEDSRCPRGTTCATAGNARVRLSVSGQGLSPSPAVVELNSTLGARFVKLGATTIRFLSLLPFPTAASKTDPASYVLTLGISSSISPTD